MTAPPTANEPAVIPAPARDCPYCGGAGFYKEAVPYGHPSFGKLFPCACKLAERESHLRGSRIDILSKPQGELGGELSRCRLELVRRAPGAQRRSRVAQEFSARRSLPRMSF